MFICIKFRGMKKLLLIACSAVLFSCGQKVAKQENAQTAVDSAKVEQFYGDKINADSAMPIADLKNLLGDKKEINIKLKAEVEAVCQKKGCWMDLKNANGEKLRVTFKDYKFFVPKDCAGKTAIVDGKASIEETSVGDLKEYAKDAGKSKAEIDAIKEPKKELVFEASGVILQ